MVYIFIAVELVSMEGSEKSSSASADIKDHDDNNVINAMSLRLIGTLGTVRNDKVLEIKQEKDEIMQGSQGISEAAWDEFIKQYITLQQDTTDCEVKKEKLDDDEACDFNDCVRPDTPAPGHFPEIETDRDNNNTDIFTPGREITESIGELYASLRTSADNLGALIKTEAENEPETHDEDSNVINQENVTTKVIKEEDKDEENSTGADPSDTLTPILEPLFKVEEYESEEASLGM